ncbi:hypothetical protein [Massilia sp. WG5]|uniref:hypothetical protein n=1 Tax=Massilia sp. WG5 TaxID=1707785 RepID=UPI000706ED8C|nr:hypothetical protein [Massilia sp. WG5]ALK97413.1 hypothetical protein AM586_15435 [Massilia sp. WG5]
MADNNKESDVSGGVPSNTATPMPGAGVNPTDGATGGSAGSGDELRKSDRARVPPGSKTGSDTRPGVGGASTGGPGGPDTGSDAMPGRSNAL